MIKDDPVYCRVIVYIGTAIIGIGLIVAPSVGTAFSLYLCIGSSLHLRSCARGVYREPVYIILWPRLVKNALLTYWNRKNGK